MDQDTQLAALMKQAEEHLEHFEQLAPRILALGDDVEILLPLDVVEAICRPISSALPLIPVCALRA